MNKDRIPKIGDIAVRLANPDNVKKRVIGTMYKAVKNSSSPNIFYYELSSNMNPQHWRYATNEEIEAYNQGIRNINDIPKIVVDNYSIY